MQRSDLNFTFPFQKINKEQRIVTGIATADNVDLADDIVDFDASVEAFSNWIGNIREMHSPVAVGKLIDWKPVPVEYNGEVYRGIEVSVYISKGAENTWQKILDGTLRGFSIGGMVQKSEESYMKRLGRKVNRIMRYTLGELSVVDNPCNPAGMFAMIKSVDGQLTYVGEEEEVKENYLFVEKAESELKDLYYCDDDDYAEIDKGDCPACGEKMMHIGKIEQFDDIIVNKMVDMYKFEIEKALSDINTVPTDAMAAEARRGLEWRKEFNRGGTAVGVARARDIMNKDRLSISTVKRMHSFFSRHEVDKQGQGFSPGEEGYPSAGRIAWALWGGDPGQRWARAITERIRNMEKAVGTDIDSMNIESPTEMVSEISKASVRVGDFVSWNSSGGRARGKVVSIVREGTLRIPDSSFSVNGTEEDPALLIQIWERGPDGWRGTDTRVGHKSSTVTIISDLDKAIDTGTIGEGGGGIKNPAQGIDEVEKIVVREGNQYCVYSEDGQRNFGCYDTKEQADERLAQMHSFSEKGNDMEKAATKREDGQDFPAEAFAYVPDPEKPSTWKLRLWDSLEDRETVAQVSRAALALSPSGFRGNRVQIPAEDLASVKAKVRAAWRRVNGAEREIPAFLKYNELVYADNSLTKGGKKVMDLQENENNGNIIAMSEDLTDTQKQSILSKMGDFLFGKSEAVQKAQTINVNTANGSFKVTTEGSMSNPPEVILNMVDATGAEEMKSMHGGMMDDMEDEEEVKSMNEDVKKSEEAASDEADSEAAADEEAIEKSEEADSTNEGEEMDLEKVLEGLSNLLDEKLEKVKAEITSEVDGKIESLEKSVSEVQESAQEVSSELEKVANSGAEKKSADVEADVVEEEVLEKSAASESFWGGIFVPQEVAKVLGYES